jgi:hypothetical protein
VGVVQTGPSVVTIASVVVPGQERWGSRRRDQFEETPLDGFRFGSLDGRITYNPFPGSTPSQSFDDLVEYRKQTAAPGTAPSTGGQTSLLGCTK